jgi:hypothetical protein
LVRAEQVAQAVRAVVDLVAAVAQAQAAQGLPVKGLAAAMARLK